MFAQPLKKFPKTISAADQKRIATDLIAAIQTQVLPSYQRFAKFMSGAVCAEGEEGSRRVGDARVAMLTMRF